MTSSAFRARVIDSTFLHGLSTLLEHVKSIDTGQTNINAGATGCTAEDVTSTVFSIIEAIAQHPLLLLEHCEIIVDGILPELGSFCTSPSGDNRILSLKLFSDISALYLEDDVVEKTRRDEKVNRSMKDLQEVRYRISRFSAPARFSAPHKTSNFDKRPCSSWRPSFG